MGQFVEIGVADVDGALDAPASIPIGLEGEATEQDIDVFLHLLRPPAGPGPELGRDEPDDGDAAALGPFREGEIEAGVVDQDEGVGPFVAEDAIGLVREGDELVEVHQDPAEPHHSQLHERIEELRARLFHPGAAEADEFGIRQASPEGLDEVGTVEVAAGLAGGEEESHWSGSHPCGWGRSDRARRG